MAAEPSPLLYPPAGWRPPWLNSTCSLAVLEALGPASVCFVGGAVRDSLLGVAASDIDMATTHRPEIVQELLTKADIKNIATGIEHGTITAVCESEVREITTLRVDVETDGRHADVAFTDNWREDAARRDFTINAIYATSEGKLFDPFSGLADLEARRVRFIGDPLERIREDALRILRFYRFSARFGDAIDEDGQAACRELAPMLEKLSAERVRDELWKLLTLGAPTRTLAAMGAAGLFEYVFPGGADLDALLAQLKREQGSGFSTSPLARLWLLASLGYSSGALAEKLKLSRKSGQRLAAIEQMLNAPAPETERDVRQLLYRFDAHSVCDACLIAAACENIQSFLNVCSTWKAPDFPVAGKDLLAQGHVPGPKVGEILAALERAWIESDFQLSKQALLARAPEPA